ncbi:hypothetical protein BGX34_008417 [Mortierella sp. NVP85]|nr:hypothetical protein BGX34_008417 [Mortierella sp. NVP85]
MGDSNDNTSGISNGVSTFPRGDATSVGRAALKHTGEGGNTSLATVDANFKEGMRLIQQAYEDKYQALIEEVNTWKWISEEQSTQMAAMAAELARVEESYAALQKEAIVSMVDQHSGVSLAQLERSILETIEADAESAGAVVDADTSSFILDDDAEPSQVSPLYQQHFVGHRYPYGKSVANGSTASLAQFKSSPRSAPSRPRASSEVSMKKGTKTQNLSRTMYKAGYSPSIQGGSSGTTALSDTFNGLKRIPKSESTDNLQSKRNTITTPSKPLYPNPTSTLTTNGTVKRHSSASPLPPRARATTASATSMAAVASSSLYSKSTPSSPPGQHPNVPSTFISDSLAARLSRQQQLKDYSHGVASSMAHLASISGVTPLSGPGLAHDDAAQSPTDLSPGLRQTSGSTNISQASRYTPRSNSDILPTSLTSTASTKLLKQQEELEEAQDTVPKSTSRSRRRSQHHADDDDEYRSPVTYEHEWTSMNEGARSHQRSYSGMGYESATRRHGSGDSSNFKYQREEPQRRQSSFNSSRSGVYSGTTSDRHRSQDTNGGGGGVDASAFTTLYKEIRDSMDAATFGQFAAVVASFNEGEKTTEETLAEVSIIVKDRLLNQRFRALIHQAIAEKENQFENNVGNSTLDGDLTLDIDHSRLLLEDDEAIDVQDQSQILGLGHDNHASFPHQDKHGTYSIQTIIESMHQDHNGETGQGLVHKSAETNSEAKETSASNDKEA